MKDYAPPWEADESNQPRKREMMHQKGSDMDECAIRYVRLRVCQGGRQRVHTSDLLALSSGNNRL
jgi:hypothetical protein